MVRLFLRPGQQLQRYEIYRKSHARDEKGKISAAVEPAIIGALMGSLVKVSQQEAERWKQQNHLVTHKIVVYGDTEAKTGDVLKRGKEKYYVHGKENRALLGKFFSLYCEYRPGV